MRGSMTYEQVRAERIADAKERGNHYRDLATDPDRPTNPNWWVFENEEIAAAVQRAVVKVGARFGLFFDSEDLESDAWIAAARIADRAEACLRGDKGANIGTFQHELEMDLMDLHRPIFGRHHKTSPGLDLDDEAQPSRMFDRYGELRGVDDEDVPADEAEPVSVRKAVA